MALNKLLTVALASTFTVLGAAPGVSQDSILGLLTQAQGYVKSCTYEAQAISHSKNIARRYFFPTEGRFVFVNIPGGQLVAYEDGSPVLEMQIKVGKKTNQTPSMNSTIDQVRINPTWTAPWSIVTENNWLDKLATDPDFFTENDIHPYSTSGDKLSIQAAAANPKLVARFIQAPGPLNALGEFRFDINSSESIYLHDTRDPQNFYDGSPLTLSHGCVRLEQPEAFASWLLNDDITNIKSKIPATKTVDLRIDSPVPILMEYFPAWPDNNGDIVIFDDIYSRLKNCEETTP